MNPQMLPECSRSDVNGTRTRRNHKSLILNGKLVPPRRIELRTSPLPRVRSTTELRRPGRKARNMPRAGRGRKAANGRKAPWNQAGGRGRRSRRRRRAGAALPVAAHLSRGHDFAITVPPARHESPLGFSLLSPARGRSPGWQKGGVHDEFGLACDGGPARDPCGVAGPASVQSHSGRPRGAARLPLTGGKGEAGRRYARISRTALLIWSAVSMVRRLASKARRASICSTASASVATLGRCTTPWASAAGCCGL